MPDGRHEVSSSDLESSVGSDELEAEMQRAVRRWHEARSLARRARNERDQLAQQNVVLRRQRDRARTTIRGLRAEAKELAVLRVQERRSSALESFAREIAAGASVPSAAVTTVRALIAQGFPFEARSFAQGLLDHGSVDSEVGHVLLGVCAVHAGHRDLARDHLTGVPDDRVRDLAMTEWLDLRAESDLAATVEAVSALAEPEQPASVWWELAKLAAGAGNREQLDTTMDRLDRASGELTGPDEGAARALRSWLDAADPAPSTDHAVVGGAASPGEDHGTVRIGVIDYTQPDRARQSANIGDYVQTLALLVNLARQRGLELSGDPELVESTARLREMVSPRVDGPEGTSRVELVRVDRDASVLQRLPAAVWTVVFGWHMRRVFDSKPKFPYHPAVRPIFLSFHISTRELLDDEAAAYLRSHQPIGCRDWTTVDLLLGAGVDAFFSGCVTTTLDAWSPPTAVDRAATPEGVLAVDLEDVGTGSPGGTVSHVDGQIADRGVGANIERAIEVLASYGRYGSVETSRLHCYLPAITLGHDVAFHPRRESDPRFPGLAGLRAGHPDLVAMRTSLRGMLDRVLGVVLTGGDVRAEWESATASLVREAKHRFHRPTEFPPAPVDTAALVTSVAATEQCGPTRHPGGSSDVVDVAIAVDASLVDQALTMLHSLISTTARPLRVHVLHRGLNGTHVESLMRCDPAVEWRLYSCDGADFGSAVLSQHITVSTMDRLLLPDLLPAVSRIVYLDVDLVVQDDVGTLFDLDLDGLPLAAKATQVRGASSGMGIVYRAAGRLSPDRAADLRRVMHQRHGAEFPTFNAGVMVLDLERMRADAFTETFIPYATEYGMNDQDVLNCYVGPRRRDLERRWNMVPAQEVTENAAVVHWAGPVKPWGPLNVAHQDVWARARRRRDAAGSGAAAP